jgi:hypothetical protein
MRCRASFSSAFIGFSPCAYYAPILSSEKPSSTAYVEGQVRLIPKYRKNMRGNSQKDAALIQQHRSRIETVNSQLEKMGLQHLHARTNEGFALKVLASLTALALTNVN